VNKHPVVASGEWLAALLRKEKEFTRQRDELSELRRELPWEAVAKAYVFLGSTGPRTLKQVFDGRSQLIVYHFMFRPAGMPVARIAPSGPTTSTKSTSTSSNAMSPWSRSRGHR
jgi:predicted dithiol-disulfide oxidoreductase (DUF899 family)